MSDNPNTETILQTPEVRVRILTLEKGESTPWHHHTQVTDTMFCLEGRIEVSLQDPEETYYLSCGDRCEVKPPRKHTVFNMSESVSRYLLVQGVGEYDFVAV